MSNKKTTAVDVAALSDDDIHKILTTALDRIFQHIDLTFDEMHEVISADAIHYVYYTYPKVIQYWYAACAFSGVAMIGQRRLRVTRRARKHKT